MTTGSGVGMTAVTQGVTDIMGIVCGHQAVLCALRDWRSASPL